MRNIKITTILALLLFAVSQGAFAQTAMDTLQRKLTTELREIAAEKRNLQRTEYSIQREKEVSQWREEGIYGQWSSSSKYYSEDLRQRRLEFERIRITELDKREDDIKRRQEVLQWRKDEIEKQLETLQRQQTEQ